MHIIDIALLTCGVLIIPVVVVVLYKNPKNPLHITFATFLVSVSLWAISIAFFRMAKFENTALFWDKMIYLSGSVAPVTVFFFSYILVNRKMPPKIITAVLVAISSAFVAVLLFFTNTWIKAIILNDAGNSVHLGTSYLAWGIYLAVVYNAGLLMLIKGLKKSKGFAAIQIKYVLMAAVLPMIMGIIPNVILPYFGNYTLIFLGPFVNAAMALIILYAIRKHRLMDIRDVLIKTLTQLISVIALAAVFAWLVLRSASTLFGWNLKEGEMIILSLLTVIAAIVLQPLKEFIEKFIHKFFVSGGYSEGTLLEDLSESASSHLNLDDLSVSTLNILCKGMGIDKAAVFVNNENEKIDLVYKNNAEIYQFPASQELKRLQKSGEMLIFEELPEGSEKTILRKSDIGVYIPLMVSGKLIAHLVLGNKKSGNIYYDKDIGLLEVFAPTLAVSMQNALSYREIQEFSKTLEKKVEERTRELEESQKKELELKDQFVFVATHDLKTPVTAIDGYLSMIKDGKIKVPAGIKNDLEQISLASERLKALVGDLLEIARGESGTMKLKLAKVDVVELIKQVVAEVEPAAGKNKIRISSKFDEVHPFVMADEEKLIEVLENILSNAVKFNKPGGKIEVTTEKKEKKLAISVSDTGYGIPKDQQRKVFSKFFKARDENTSQVPGTGLGLFVSKMLVVKMRGKISFKSRAGKGTTFKLLLPLAKE